MSLDVTPKRSRRLVRKKQPKRDLVVERLKWLYDSIDPDIPDDQLPPMPTLASPPKLTVDARDTAENKQPYVPPAPARKNWAASQSLREELARVVKHHPRLAGVGFPCSSVPLDPVSPCERYTDYMIQGKEMPPVLINEDGLLMDGRHRLLAASRLCIDLQIEVTDEYPWVLAYKNLLTRQTTKTQLAGFAANLIDSIRGVTRYSRIRKRMFQETIGFLLEFSPHAEENYRALNPRMGKIAVRLANFFGLSETLIKDALRLPINERYSAIDGRAIYSIAKELKAAKK